MISACSSARCATWPKSWTTPSSWKRLAGRDDAGRLEAEGFSLTVLPFRTTAENLARYVCDRLTEQGFPVSQVDLYETPNNCAIYRRTA